MLKKVVKEIKIILETFQEHRLSASAAHAAFFIILSFLPCIILFFSLLQFTSLQKTDVMMFIESMVPQQMRTLFLGIINEAYNKTATTVSISAIAALWSAGRGMMALTQGLQCIAGIRETRNYFTVRIRAAFYTVVLLVVVIIFLLLGVFGNTLMKLIMIKFPVTTYVMNMISDVKNVFLILFAVVIFTIIYRFMPGNQMALRKHLPGALVSSLGWFIYTFAFSIYIEKFHGFSDMYGSLTTSILVMLWLYFGMYIMLIGAETNQLLAKKGEKLLAKKGEKT